MKFSESASGPLMRLPLPPVTDACQPQNVCAVLYLTLGTLSPVAVVIDCSAPTKCSKRNCAVYGLTSVDAAVPLRKGRTRYTHVCSAVAGLSSGASSCRSWRRKQLAILPVHLLGASCSRVPPPAAFPGMQAIKSNSHPTVH